MAVTAKIYGLAFLSAFNKEIDLNSDDMRVALLTSAYVPNQDTHDYYDDVVANEVVGTGYTAGGAALTAEAITYDGATNTFKFDAADVSWPASTITARYAVIYSRTPATDATRPLFGYIDFGADVSSTGGAFSIAFDTNGIATVTVA